MPSRSTPQHRSSLLTSSRSLPTSSFLLGHRPKARAAPTSWASACVHVLCLVAAAGVVHWCLSFRGGFAWNAANKELIFNLHPVCMIVGFVVTYSEANLAYKTVGGSKSYKKLIHLLLQGAALFLGLVGIFAAFKFHNEKGIDNLYSLHSWLGVLTIVAFAVQWLIGFTIFWYPGGASYVRGRVLPWHIFLGLFIYGLALTSAETGLLEKITFLQGAKSVGRFSVEAMLVNALGLVLIVLGALVIWVTLDYGGVVELSNK